MTHKTIQIEENAQHENESLVMMEREQGDLQRHDHLFFELAYITGGTCEHTLNDIKTVLHRGDYFFVDLGSTHRYENSCGLTLINCHIAGTQPLCYCKNLKLVNCTMENTDLSVEYSEVEADVTGDILSVKNPHAGHICADHIGQIILEDSVMENHCQIRERG